MNELFTQHDRDLLDKILDEIIPANAQKRIPSAGAAGVGDFIELRAAGDNKIRSAVSSLLAIAASIDSAVTEELVRQLETRNSQSFLVLLRLTYMGYYSQPVMRAGVGLASWPVHPKGYDVPLESVESMQQLTSSVTARGRFYREVENTDKAHS